LECDINVGQEYISNASIKDSTFPGHISKQGFLMFNKIVTGKAVKGESVARFIDVELDESTRK